MVTEIVRVMYICLKTGEKHCSLEGDRGNIESLKNLLTSS